MKKVLVFTDLHIRDQGQTIINLDPVALFKEGLAHGLQTHPDAEHVVICGDLTHSGKLSEYQILKNALSEVSIPYTLMMGNHDRRDHFKEIFPEISTDKNGFMQSYQDIDDVRLVFLDTLIGPPFKKDQHHGLLCEKRLNWLENTLITAQEKRIVLFLHHPPFITGFCGMDLIRLKNDMELLHLLKGHDHIAHIVAGHVHRTISGSWNGYSFSILKSTCHQMPMVLEAQSPAFSVAEPASYGLLLIMPNQIIMHSEDFQLAHRDVQPSQDAIPE